MAFMPSKRLIVNCEFGLIVPRSQTVDERGAEATRAQAAPHAHLRHQRRACAPSAARL
jgi:hypothetical protein